MAFEALGGVPRVLLYDNLKTAVLERQGEQIRFHPHLLELAGHYQPSAYGRFFPTGEPRATLESGTARSEVNDVDTTGRHTSHRACRRCYGRPRMGLDA
jgi:hypothetical protein